MKTKIHQLAAGSALLLTAFSSAFATPVVSRLTPPSLLFSTGSGGAPYIARFLPGQRFDLQATVQPDSGQTITGATFKVDNVAVSGTVTLIACTQTGTLQSGSKLSTLATGSVSPTLRAYSTLTPGVHTLTVTATQSDSLTATASTEFEVVSITQTGRKAKNLIVMIGDGMGIAHRTAARIMYKMVVSGKSLAPLEMDSMSSVALVKTSSLNSIVTDSAPGAACYSTGNKCNNNQEGVFPDDTLAKFDNPRVEFVGEYLARTQGKSLGIVTTADVFDATPAAFAVHTQDRGAGTGIVDQYLDEAVPKANLTVLLGGGRKWFLQSAPTVNPTWPNSVTGTGSARVSNLDYVLPSELATGWGLTGAQAGNASDTNRDLITDFQAAGFTYVPDRTSLLANSAAATKLLGLFNLANMNVALDKIDGQRGTIPSGSSQTIVADYGFTDQPMLNEMTTAALNVLKKNTNGFVLMVEGASIDKQAHNMDTDRWLLETIEFDKAIGVAKAFAVANPDTLVLVTADHECAGVNIIGASTVTDAALQTNISTAGAVTGTSSTNGANLSGVITALRGTGATSDVVGTYDNAKFPVYSLAADGYPTTTDVDYRMLIGYAANADRYEDWRKNPKPLKDTQQIFSGQAPLSTYPAGPTAQDTAGKFYITGQVGGSSAVHTASDIPLTASGRGSSLFKGSLDNTDVFFLAMQAVLGGAN